MAVHLQEAQNESVPLLPEAQRQRYTRELQMTEGLLGLAASLSRMSVDLLAEISRWASKRVFDLQGQIPNGMCCRFA